MTPHQVVTVGVRLFAIWVGIHVVRDTTWYFLSQSRDDGFAVLVAGFALFALAFIVFLWFFPRSVARGLLPQTQDEPAPAAPPATWLATGASLIGLWLIATALPALSRNATVMLVFRSESTDLRELGIGMILYAIQIAIGLALIVGADGVRRFLVWARHAGVK